MTPTGDRKNPGTAPRPQKVGRLYRGELTLALLHVPQKGEHARHGTGEIIPVLLAVRVSRKAGE